MTAWLGPEFPPFLEAMSAPPDVGLRVNTQKISPENFLTRSPFPLRPVPWCPEGFVVTDPTARPGIHPYHEAGLYYLQDPAAVDPALAGDEGHGLQNMRRRLREQGGDLTISSQPGAGTRIEMRLALR